jgi:hypothetical protein
VINIYEKASINHWTNFPTSVRSYWKNHGNFPILLWPRDCVSYTSASSTFCLSWLLANVLGFCIVFWLWVWQGHVVFLPESIITCSVHGSVCTCYDWRNVIEYESIIACTNRIWQNIWQSVCGSAHWWLTKLMQCNSDIWETLAAQTSSPKGSKVTAWHEMVMSKSSHQERHRQRQIRWRTCNEATAVEGREDPRAPQIFDDKSCLQHAWTEIRVNSWVIISFTFVQLWALSSSSLQRGNNLSVSGLERSSSIKKWLVMHADRYQSRQRALPRGKTTSYKITQVNGCVSVVTVIVVTVIDIVDRTRGWPW